MTDLARGGKCGRPSGGVLSARATPSLKSMAPSARPVKPMPVSARNVRRLMRPQPTVLLCAIFPPSFVLTALNELGERVNANRSRLRPEPLQRKPEPVHHLTMKDPRTRLYRPVFPVGTEPQKRGFPLHFIDNPVLNHRELLILDSFPMVIQVNAAGRDDLDRDSRRPVDSATQYLSDLSFRDKDDVRFRRIVLV